MRVLHAINDLAAGGAEKLLLDLLPEMNRRGVRADLVVLDDTPHPFLRELRRRAACASRASIGASSRAPSRRRISCAAARAPVPRAGASRPVAAISNIQDTDFMSVVEQGACQPTAPVNPPSGRPAASRRGWL